MRIKQRVNPSAAAFMDCGEVVTEYSGGCLRMILAKAAGLKSDIPEKYMIMGELNELNYYRDLVDSNEYSLILDELPIKTPTGIGNVIYSGRMDFLTYKKGCSVPEVHELKSTMSSGTLSKAKKGELKINQLAQLVSYLTVEELPVGYLHIRGYSEKKIKGTETKEIVPKIRRDTKKQHQYHFKVEILSGGEITVDGRLTGYDQQDYIQHLQAVARMLDKPVVYKRPLGWFEERSMCDWCDLKNVCNITDEENLTAEEFVSEALKLNEESKND